MPVDRSESIGSKSHHATASNVAQNAKKKLNKLYRSRSNTDSSIQAIPREYEDVGSLPDSFRNRLYDLFGAIEKEFELLYAENFTLNAKVETLTAKLAEGGVSLDKAVEFLDIDSSNTKAIKKSSQVSQKIKTAFRVPPGRLVSSFKAGVGVGGYASRVSYIRTFTGHRDGVWDVDTVCASSCSLIGSASADQTAYVWCNESGCILAQYTGHSGSVNSIRFCPVEQNLSDVLVLTASGDNSAHIWKPNISPGAATVSHQPLPGSSDDEIDPTSEKEEESGAQHNIVRSPLLELTGHSGVVISADWLIGGCQVITASWDRTARIYDAERGEILHVLSGLVVTASKDTTFRLWDFREPIHSVSVFQGHTDAVTSAVFSVADKVVSGSDDRTVKVWDLRNMRSALATIRLDSPINRIAVSSTYNIIAIPHDNCHVRLYDLQGTRIARLPRSNRRGHRRMVCSTMWFEENRADVPNLITCAFDKTIIGWKVNLPITKDVLQKF